VNTTGQKSKPARSSLHFTMLRNATDTHYSTFRCEGVHGCGERLTTDALGEHAAKQHGTYDYTKDNEVKTGG